MIWPRCERLRLTNPYETASCDVRTPAVCGSVIVIEVVKACPLVTSRVEADGQVRGAVTTAPSPNIVQATYLCRLRSIWTEFYLYLAVVCRHERERPRRSKCISHVHPSHSSQRVAALGYLPQRERRNIVTDTKHHARQPLAARRSTWLRCPPTFSKA